MPGTELPFDVREIYRVAKENRGKEKRNRQKAQGTEGLQRLYTGKYNAMDKVAAERHIAAEAGEQETP